MTVTLPPPRLVTTREGCRGRCGRGRGLRRVPTAAISRRRVEVEDGDVVGAGVGDVGAMAVWCDVDEVGFLVDGDGGGDGVLLGVDDGDGA